MAGGACVKTTIETPPIGFLYYEVAHGAGWAGKLLSPLPGNT